ncbi:MAG: MBL fold metallo-hydrolase, partial [Planctomycetota bacterium]
MRQTERSPFWRPSESFVVKLHFLGANRQVTGSRYCLEVGNRRLMVDCGLFQEREFKDRNWEPCPLSPDSIDALVLTHAHIDHCGLVPRLVKDGFKGPVYATEPTADLLGLMWEDSARIQEEDAKYKQKRHKKEGKVSPRGYAPLYDEDDVQRAI